LKIKASQAINGDQMEKQEIGMAKRYQANGERIDAIGTFGKSIGKRAGFKCEWCETKEELQLLD